MRHLSGEDEINDFIVNNTDKVTILYFGAKWCGPCKKLKEYLTNDALNNLSELVVGYLDVDDKNNKEFCDLYEVESLPTIFYINLNDNRVEVNDKIVGFDQEKIEELYYKYKKN